MPGVVPGIHAFISEHNSKTWMAGTRGRPRPVSTAYAQPRRNRLRFSMSNAPTTLRIALGDYPHTLPLKRGEITSPRLKLEFVEVKPMHKAFKPMVREHAFDVSEMALVTAIQAKAYGKGLTLLPATMLSRFQHGTILHNAER